MLSVDSCICPKITYVRAFFAWSVISLGSHQLLGERLQIFFLYLIPSVAMRPSLPKTLDQFLLSCMHHPYQWSGRQSTSAGTDGHCVPGLPSTASPDINQQSRIVLSLEPQTGYMTFPKVIQSVKNILPEIKCLGTEHSALKQFNKL